MTPKNKLFVLFAVIGWLEGTKAAAFSNVIVHRHEVVPLEYINYNPSSLQYSNAQLARLSAAQATSVPSLSAVVSPCVSPCVIPNSPIPRLLPIPSSNAKIVTYEPSVPNVVVTNKEAARGYQYAYAVFDDNTGDMKSQSEQSDGSVVQGKYSFIQPDGFLREVIYTADDTKGFNAVVKNISPEPASNQKEDKVEIVKQPATPCPEPIILKNEQLTQLKGIELSPEELRSDPELLGEKESDEKIPEKKDDNNVEEIVGKVEIPDEQSEKPAEVIPLAPPSVQESPVPNPVITYNDILKCLQTKLQGTQNISPLTYVLIPSIKGTC